MEKEFLLPQNVLCGYFDCSEFGALTHSPKRHRSRFEIEYYLSDGKTTVSDEKVYLIRKNYILIGKPNEICNSELPFETKFLKFEAEGLLAQRLLSAPTYFPSLHPYETEKLLDELILLSSSENYDTVLFYGKLLSLLSLILDDARSETASIFPTQEMMARAQKYMCENLSSPIKLSDIAASVSLSPSYFHSLFSKMCGMTPHDYLQRERIRYAKELLATTSLTIAEIAERCGFVTQQYLNSVFKQCVGLSPGKCRKEYRKNYFV
ncbi:MAG: helix-turn-helix transcriptional regulator [Clostridia bacterium]|nr:helix-turn-helix transcriptional regulator [Clostridia bacterium]